MAHAWNLAHMDGIISHFTTASITLSRYVGTTFCISDFYNIKIFSIIMIYKIYIENQYNKIKKIFIHNKYYLKNIYINKFFYKKND